MSPFQSQGEPRQPSWETGSFQETDQIFGMLFFFHQNFFQQPARGRIIAADEGDHVPITLDRDALSAAVRAAQASETRARAALADLFAGTRPERIAALVAGKPVAVTTSKAYGCSVKYAK